MRRLTIGLGVMTLVMGAAVHAHAQDAAAEKKIIRVGVIGLDTSHSIAFAQMLNAPDAAPDLAGFRVVAAYPRGSADIESSVSRIPEYTQKYRDMGIEIVDSIDALIGKVDAVLLETNDGRVHLEQAVPVMKAGKAIFIDKPIAASLADAVALFDAAERFNVPMFSASSLRWMTHVGAVRAGEHGRVLGAETYTPISYEATHPDLYWYGIHGVEPLVAVMGPDVETVRRVKTDKADVTVGTWSGGRVGIVRGIPAGAGHRTYGGRALTEKAAVDLGKFETYRPLLVDVARMFRTGAVPVERDETLAIYAFMSAAQQSAERDGAAVNVAEVMAEASREAKKRLAEVLGE